MLTKEIFKIEVKKYSFISQVTMLREQPLLSFTYKYFYIIRLRNGLMDNKNESGNHFNRK